MGSSMIWQPLLSSALWTFGQQGPKSFTINIKVDNLYTATISWYEITILLLLFSATITIICLVNILNLRTSDVKTYKKAENREQWPTLG